MSSTWLGEEQITGKLIEFPGKVITCVSQLPSGEGFGFGDEEGWLHFSGVDDSSPSSKPIKVIESDRPLNQIAFSTFEGQKFIAASSASNIAIHNLSRQGESSPHLRTEFGAHGIYASSWGGFLAPLGPSGLAHFRPISGGKLEQNMLSHRDGRPYFYSMSRIGPTSGRSELWACAGRSLGVMAIALEQSGALNVLQTFKQVKSPMDYVGVWSISNSQLPYACVSLSSDRRVEFRTSVISDDQPITLTCPGVEGVAYSLLAADGSLFILTSKGIYVWMDIVKVFLKGELRPGNVRSKVRSLSMEAIEFGLLYKRWMMVLRNNGILRLDIGDLGVLPHSVGKRELNEEAPWFDSSPSEAIWTDVALPTELVAA